MVIPKVSSVAYVDDVSARLDAAGARPEMSIWAMIETPTAIFDVRAIVAHPRVSVLVMGTNDLARELRAQLLPGRHPLVPHLATALLAAREAGKVIVDGVFNDVKDLDGFRAECVQGWEMGFDGKTLIHPGQVDIANDVWAPSDDDVAHARRVIEAFEDGLAVRQGRRHRRRPDDREPPRRQRPAGPGHRRGHRRAVAGRPWSASGALEVTRRQGPGR